MINPKHYKHFSGNHKRSRSRSSSHSHSDSHADESYDHGIICLPCALDGVKSEQVISVCINTNQIVAMYAWHRNKHLEHILPNKQYWFKIETNSKSYLVASNCEWEEFVDAVFGEDLEDYESEDYESGEDEEKESDNSEDYESGEDEEKESDKSFDATVAE